jgi:hypothetical protein
VKHSKRPAKAVETLASSGAERATTQSVNEGQRGTEASESESESEPLVGNGVAQRGDVVQRGPVDERDEKDQQCRSEQHLRHIEQRLERGRQQAAGAVIRVDGAQKRVEIFGRCEFRFVLEKCVICCHCEGKGEQVSRVI